jgi:hypothetical protein
MTDDTFKTNIKYDAKRVLKYLSWTRRPLTPLEHEAIKFLRCASFGHGLSKAHANEWLAYEREFGGRAALLPKCIDTVWSTMAKAHRDMSDEIMRKTVVLPIPIEVHVIYVHCPCTFDVVVVNENCTCRFLMHLLTFLYLTPTIASSSINTIFLCPFLMHICNERFKCTFQMYILNVHFKFLMHILNLYFNCSFIILYCFILVCPCRYKNLCLYRKRQCHLVL